MYNILSIICQVIGATNLVAIFWFLMKYIRSGGENEK